MNAADLVLHAKSGDAEAFTELVRRYQAMAFGYAYTQLGDFHLAEDAAQQAFITAYRHLPQLMEPERFGGWLRTIVRYECLHLLRVRPTPSLPLEHADRLADAVAVDAAQRSEDGEGVDRAFTAVRALPQAEREVTVLYYIHAYSQREVAAFLGLPVTTVNNRLRAARAALRQGQVLSMTPDAFHDHRLPDAFATRVGEIVRSHGAFVDARFQPDARPQVLSALTVTDETADPLVTIEAVQFLNDTLVRCIPITGGAAQIDAGMRVRDTGGPVRAPLDHGAITHIIATVPPPAPLEIMETGIKAIDLLCPILRAGRIALVGDMQVGKMVLVEELVHRLAASAAELTIVVFVETPDEVTAVNAQAYRASPQVAAMYLPVADARPAALGALTAELDAVITVSGELGRRRLYPAIDPVRSTSRLLTAGGVDRTHAATASRVRALFQAEGGEGAASERVRHFLTQPFFVTEPLMQRPGQHVPIGVTIRACQALLDGQGDAMNPDDLYVIGPLPNADEHGN